MNARRIARWTVIILSLQVILLGALNSYLLSDKAQIHIKRSAMDLGGLKSISRIQRIKTFKSRLLPGATNVQLSYDYKYMAYGVIRDGVEKLEVDTIGGKGEPIPVEIPEGTTLSFIRWLPDRHRLFFIVDSERRGFGEMQLWYYDIGLEKSGLVKVIDELPLESKPGLMSMSTFTNLIYLTVDTPDNGSYLYRIDIMGDCRKLRLRKRDITSLQVLPKNDVVYMEEGETGKILVLLKGSISELTNLEGRTVRGRIVGYGQDDELIVAGYPGRARSSEANRLVYADNEGLFLGMVGFSRRVSVDSIKVSDTGDILRLTSMQDGSLSIRTQSRKQLWRIKGELLKADKDNVAFVEGDGDRGSNLLVKSRVSLLQ